MVARCERAGAGLLVLIGDKNFRGKQFEADLAALDARILRPRRKDEKTTADTPSQTTAALRPASQITPQPARHTPSSEPHLAAIRQRIESIFWTFKVVMARRPPRADEIRHARGVACHRRGLSWCL